MPLRIWARNLGESLPTHSVSSARSTAMICDVFATDSFGNPVALPGSSTFPGASAQVRLLVIGMQTAVAILLLLRGLP